jgi:hypothetical protein
MPAVLDRPSGMLQAMIASRNDAGRKRPRHDDQRDPNGCGLQLG